MKFCTSTVKQNVQSPFWGATYVNSFPSPPPTHTMGIVHFANRSYKGTPRQGGGGGEDGFQMGFYQWPKLNNFLQTRWSLILCPSRPCMLAGT